MGFRSTIKNLPGYVKGLCVVAVLFVAFVVSVPVVTFDDPCCTVLEASHGELLGAHIAADGQWRFPPADSVPQNFARALITFEDRWFFYHPGVNPISLVNAFVANVRAGEVVRGGSTITMQVVRLSRKGKPRIYKEKLIEIVYAMRLEIACSKKEILALYASHAPFGGNVVGLEAASWRYFQRPAHQLSAAEYALLAVLPNAPSDLHLNKNRGNLLQKRNRLLAKLHHKGFIITSDYHLALEEPLPTAPGPMPDIAGVLTEKTALQYPGQRVRTAIDVALQKEVNETLNYHLQSLEANEIHNVAAVVLEVPTGNVVAWAGNVCRENHPEYSPHVDMVSALRSTGSILKPFLYCAMLDDGMILPDMLVADIPSNFNGYTPKNYSGNYCGALPASEALSRSLNIPAVRMLAQYDVARFHNLLQQCGMTSLAFPPSHYGLSLILGGAEASLIELAGIYRNMAAFLSSDTAKWEPAALIPGKCKEWKCSPLGRASIYCTFEAMQKVNRPEELSGWENFASTGDIAWKTGTSFGFRDAWAIGVTPGYVVGVWAGNADGEGRPGLTGTGTAAPVMFDVFHLLPLSGEFPFPEDDMILVPVCPKSGHTVSRFCPDTLWQWVPQNGAKTKPCPYHQRVHLDQDSLYRVSSACYPVEDMVSIPWFVLPPSISYYYRKANALYQKLPPLKPGCVINTSKSPLSFIYPADYREIWLPRKMDGSKAKLILQAAHQNPDAKIYWYLDDQYLGDTHHFHTMECQPDKGLHSLTILDDDGNSQSVNIRIYHQKKP